MGTYADHDLEAFCVFGVCFLLFGFAGERAGEHGAWVFLSIANHLVVKVM